ncbi:hypothetical protein ABZ348_07500 [Streptomyces sp. NPDC005963]|uniref:hypothetical protein n=1 Tax=Streptomyces sp. NPDC005963 TaxID=3156721 RepID=UPI0033FA71FC
MDDELRPEDFDDVLATVGLYTDSVLLGDDRTRDREASVTFVRPLVYRIAGPQDDGAPVDVLLCFPFDLAPLTGARTYTSVQLGVELDDMSARALEPAPASGTVLPDGTQASVFGRGGHRLRWVFERPRGGLRPDGHWAQVLVRLEPDRTEVSGRLTAEVVIRRTLLGRPVGASAGTRESVRFQLSVADAWPLAAPGPALPFSLAAERHDVPEPVPDDTAEAGGLAQLPWLRRLMFAVDVERYSHRHDTQMPRIQRDLWRAVRGACTASGIDWHTCGRQASGDGYLLVLPVGVDEPRTVDRLLRGLTFALHAANSDPNRPDDLLPTRMRASLHQGLTREGHSGFLGTAVVELFRVLDSAPLRTALRETDRADLAVAWSDPLYRDLVPHAYLGLDERSFECVRVEIPEKEFTSRAWIRVHPRPGPAV